MEYIPDTEYITINKNGFFIGGKKVIGHNNVEKLKPTKFHGHEIRAMDAFGDDFDSWFEYARKKIPTLEEIHSGAFDTKGERYQIGQPSGKLGKTVWCRIKLNGKDATNNPWVLYSDSIAVWDAVLYGGMFALKDFYKPEFVSALLNAANTDSKKIDQPQKTNLSENDTSITDLKQRLQNIDLSELVGKTVELNGYKIMIRKIAQNTKTTNER